MSFYEIMNASSNEVSMEFNREKNMINLLSI